jgi:hypothetical protein
VFWNPALHTQTQIIFDTAQDTKHNGQREEADNHFRGFVASFEYSNITRPRTDKMAEYLGVTEAAFEWADSYDSKDWDRLKKCIAPTLRVRCQPATETNEFGVC